MGDATGCLRRVRPRFIVVKYRPHDLAGFQTRRTAKDESAILQIADTSGLIPSVTQKSIRRRKGNGADRFNKALQGMPALKQSAHRTIPSARAGSASQHAFNPLPDATGAGIFGALLFLARLSLLTLGLGLGSLLFLLLDLALALFEIVVRLAGHSSLQAVCHCKCSRRAGPAALLKPRGARVAHPAGAAGCAGPGAAAAILDRLRANHSGRPLSAGDGDRHTDERLDIAQEGLFGRIAERHATPSAPARAVRPMRWT